MPLPTVETVPSPCPPRAPFSAALGAGPGGGLFGFRLELPASEEATSPILQNSS